MTTRTKDNVLHGTPIPQYLLNSKSNLSQYFIRLISEFQNKTAMVDGHDGSSFTFENILNASFNIAHWLKYECDIQKNDVVGILSENTLWYPSIMLAVWHVGAVCAFYNPMYTASFFYYLCYKIFGIKLKGGSDKNLSSPAYLRAAPINLPMGGKFVNTALPVGLSAVFSMVLGLSYNEYGQ